MYGAVVLLLLVVTDALGSLPARWPVIVPFAAFVGISVWINANLLTTFADGRAGFIATQTAELRTIEAYRSEPDTTPDATLEPRYTPITPRQFYDAIDAWGSPVPPTTRSEVSTMDPAAVDSALVTLFANGLAPMPAPADATCASGTSLTVPAGSSILVTPDAGGRAVVSIARVDGDSVPPSATITAPALFVLRGAGLAGDWRVHVQGAQVCRTG
jgi:hypothetical protein